MAFDVAIQIITGKASIIRFESVLKSFGQIKSKTGGSKMVAFENCALTLNIDNTMTW